MEEIVAKALTNSYHKRLAYLEGKKLLQLIDMQKSTNYRIQIDQQSHSPDDRGFLEKGVWKIVQDSRLINVANIPRIRIPFRGNWAVMDVCTLQSSTHPLLETSHAQHISPHAVLCPNRICDQIWVPVGTHLPSRSDVMSAASTPLLASRK